MPSVDEDNVVEKGELEATKVNYTFCRDNTHQGLKNRVTPEKQEGEKGEEDAKEGGEKDACNSCKTDQEVVFIQA